MPMDVPYSDRILSGDELCDVDLDLDLDLALEAAGAGAWNWDPATGAMSCSSRMRTICGIPRRERVTFDMFLAHVRREDRVRTRTVLLQAFHDGMARSIECGLAGPSAGTERWISIEGRPCPLPDSTMRMFGIARDISERRLADDQQELASCDLEHRIQNLFTVLTSMVALSQRFADTPAQLAHSLETRIGALARAHELVRGARSVIEVELQDVIASELAPFSDLSNVSIRGAHVRLGSAQAMAMNVIIHELATNAVKYGALSQPGGLLSIEWSVESPIGIDTLLLRWKECCGHPIARPTTQGLGSKLLTSSARSLRGDILLEFESTGLRATLAAPI
jgi:two-component sensor histidine kinase